jgi:hypothetical protein
MSHRQTRLERIAEGSFPYWVCLPEERCTGANYDKHQSFCQAHGLKLSRHGHSVVWQREWYCVFRFAEQEHAYRFMKEFGGDTWTAAPGYAVREHQDDNNTHERLAEEDATIALASTTAAKFTTSTSNPWAAVMASFKPLVTSTGGGGAGTSTSASTTIRYIANDNLTGSNIVTDQSGSVVETLDYYPYGGIRIDSKTNYGGSRRRWPQDERWLV